MAETLIGRNGHTPAEGTAVEPPWPPPVDARAYHGPAGEFVRAIAPQTEADPVGILAVLLSGCGNALDRHIYCDVSGKRHELRANVALVGPTALGRKGTAQAVAEALLEEATPHWLRRRKFNGLSSGEGLIWAVRDPLVKQEPIRDKDKTILRYQEVVEDAGESDKRLWVVEEEFASVIKVLSREGNTLSTIVRNAWDGNPLRSLTRNPYGTDEAHVTIVGHITPVELAQHLTSTEAANGFANRFLWLLVRKAREIEDDDAGLDRGVLNYYGTLLGDVLEEWRERPGRLRRDDEARTLWRQVKPTLERRPAGLVGAVTARATQQVIRLSAIYAALDVSARIARVHLEAALALWQYAEDSVRCIFGDTTGDPVIDRIIVALRERPRTSTELRNLFSRNLPQLEDTLELMEGWGWIVGEQIRTGKPGKPPTVWRLVAPGPAGEGA